MPTIEIISLRLNLDKADDRLLFETIGERADAGKRNEFLKQALLEYLTAKGAGGSPPARQLKSRQLAKVDRTVGPESPVPAVPPLPDAPRAPLPSDKPIEESPVVGHGGPGMGHGGDKETAGFVTSFLK